ncbi:MAG: hypothetical protein ACP5PX_07390 [Candidatus Hadarchaeum sp.]|uniref:hypothetical protein n=1 Tax=Candidatus Hadarchaeum sp. TaxID=2883567 RepID=UPI003D1062FC
MENRGLKGSESCLWAKVMCRRVSQSIVALFALAWGWWLFWGSSYERASYFREKAEALASSKRFFEEVKAKGGVPPALRTQEEAVWFYALRSLEEGGSEATKKRAALLLVQHFIKIDDLEVATKYYKLVCPQGGCLPDYEQVLGYSLPDTSSGRNGK